MPKLINNAHCIRAHEIAEDRTKTRAQKFGTVGLSILEGLEHISTAALVHISDQVIFRDIYDRLDRISAAPAPLDCTNSYSLKLDLAPNAPPRHIRLDHTFLAQLLQERPAFTAPVSDAASVPNNKRAEVLRLVLKERICRLQKSTGRSLAVQSTSNPLTSLAKNAKCAQANQDSELNHRAQSAPLSNLGNRSSDLSDQRCQYANPSIVQAIRDFEIRQVVQKKSSLGYDGSQSSIAHDLEIRQILQSIGYDGAQSSSEYASKSDRWKVLKSRFGLAECIIDTRGVYLLSVDVHVKCYGAKSMRYLQQMETGPPALQMLDD